MTQANYQYNYCNFFHWWQLQKNEMKMQKENLQQHSMVIVLCIRVVFYSKKVSQSIVSHWWMHLCHWVCHIWYNKTRDRNIQNIVIVQWALLVWPHQSDKQFLQWICTKYSIETVLLRMTIELLPENVSSVRRKWPLYYGVISNGLRNLPFHRLNFFETRCPVLFGHPSTWNHWSKPMQRSQFEMKNVRQIQMRAHCCIHFTSGSFFINYLSVFCVRSFQMYLNT